ncbi:hypothetical protein [Treponema sp.]|uniref:hypothetical protein n=1 Tax=Treponema sp. TaxID=166 RepID=UPI00388F37BF
MKKKFQDFYKRLEEAGRKHFYLFKLPDEEISEGFLLGKIKDIPNETERTFDPEEDNQKIFKKVSDNYITIKKIQIRKAFSFVEDKFDDNYLTKKYRIENVHYITFVTFDFNKNRIICGYDSCGDLLDKKKSDKELFEFIYSVTGKDLKYEFLLTSNHIDNIRFLQNCLAYSISNKANSFDFANFKKSKANFENIKKDLKQEKYKINEIKDNNPDFDLQTNVLYNAGIKTAIADEFELLNNNCEFYYFTDVTNHISYFRMRFNINDSSIITFSESITKEELQDVFKQID